MPPLPPTRQPTSIRLSSHRPPELTRQAVPSLTCAFAGNLALGHHEQHAARVRCPGAVNGGSPRFATPIHPLRASLQRLSVSALSIVQIALREFPMNIGQIRRRRRICRFDRFCGFAVLWARWGNYLFKTAQRTTLFTYPLFFARHIFPSVGITFLLFEQCPP